MVPRLQNPNQHARGQSDRERVANPLVMRDEEPGWQSSVSPDEQARRPRHGDTRSPTTIHAPLARVPGGLRGYLSPGGVLPPVKGSSIAVGVRFSRIASCPVGTEERPPSARRLGTRPDTCFLRAPFRASPPPATACAVRTFDLHRAGAALDRLVPVPGLPWVRPTRTREPSRALPAIPSGPLWLRSPRPGGGLASRSRRVRFGAVPAII